jgi:hypothetical protein
MRLGQYRVEQASALLGSALIERRVELTRPISRGAGDGRAETESGRGDDANRSLDARRLAIHAERRRSTPGPANAHETFVSCPLTSGNELDLPEHLRFCRMQGMRVRRQARAGFASAFGLILGFLTSSGCGEVNSATSSSGGITAAGGAGSGGVGGVGGVVSPGAGGAGTTAGASECLCPVGGAPYSVLVRGDGDDSILHYNTETPASVALACADWLSGPLRGNLRSGCGGKRLMFAACVGPDAGPACLLVDYNSVTYIDRAGLSWSGSVQDLKPSLSPTLMDPRRQEGAFSVQVTRDGVELKLFVAYLLCGTDIMTLIPC